VQAVNDSHARNHLKSLIEDVNTNFEEYIITTKDNVKKRSQFSFRRP